MLFLSIKPQYVEKILTGEKQVELRRQKPRSLPNDWLAIYESSPTMALVGMARVTEVQVKSRGRLWRSVSAIAGVTKSEFDDYFDGCELAVGILFQTVMKFKAPVTLNDLRSVWPEFHPPQGFRYLTPTQQRFVLKQLTKQQGKRVA